MRPQLKLITLIAASLLAGCGTQDSADPVNSGGAPATLPVAPSGQVVAAVGAGGVTAEDYLDRAMRSPAATTGDMSDEERQDIIDALVTEEALWQEACAKGMYRDSKVRKIMVNLLLREEIYTNVKASDFSPDELHSYYDDHLEEFVVPEKIQVKRILLKNTPDRDAAAGLALAADLRGQLLKQPDRFQELAAKYSDGPYKRRGGDLGYISREGKAGIDADVIAKAFELDVGEVSEPFTSESGVNLVAVVVRRERQERSFENMKGSVLRKLKNERYKELTESYVAGIKGKYPVTVYQEAIDGLDLAGARSGKAASQAAAAHEASQVAPIDLKATPTALRPGMTAPGQK